MVHVEADRDQRASRAGRSGNRASWPRRSGGRLSLREYHEATKHSLASVQSNRHFLDWPNQPLPFKIYTSLEAIGLPLSFPSSDVAALSAIAGDCPRADRPIDLQTLARLLFFSNGVTRVLHRMPFRAAACTGALYHIEVYAVCSDLGGLGSGVYHYGAHDRGLRRLRGGDFRRVVSTATGEEPSVVQAPVVLALTSTWWRNAWKYQGRAYRHAFWDSGTVLANLLATACSVGTSAKVIIGFADAPINQLLDVDPSHEGTICLVALGGGAPPAPDAPPLEALDLPTQRLSHDEVAYPLITDAHAASSLSSGRDVNDWRSRYGPPPPSPPVRAPSGESIESVILRRGSSRRFTHAPISADQLYEMMRVCTSLTPSDAWVSCQPYVIANAVDGLASGTYVWNRESAKLEMLRSGDFRREAAFLDLGQELAGDAAVDVYWLVDLQDLDDRGYRAAQLGAATEAGKLYLAAYSLGLGATGLTFFDDDVTRFFSPHAQGKSVMFLMALGEPALRR